MGYYGIFLGMQYRNDVAVLKKLERNGYDESQTVTLKVQISIPYGVENSDFERVDGMFEHHGEFYRLVKQKYEKDTLTVICIKDFEIKRIKQALTNYVKTFTDQGTEQHQNTKPTVNFIKDYIPQTFSLKSSSLGWESEVIKETVYNALLSSFASSIIHPPERG